MPSTQRMACGMPVACPLTADLSNVPAGHAAPASGTRKQTLAEALSALSTLVNRHSCLLFPVQTQQKPQIPGVPQAWLCHQPPGNQQQREQPSAKVRRRARSSVWVSNTHRAEEPLRGHLQPEGSQPNTDTAKKVPIPHPSTQTHPRPTQ